MRRLVFLLCCAVALGACNSDDEYDATVPTDMALVKGDGQAGDVGATLPESLTVLVTNLKGDPVEGVTVEWLVLTGGGALSAPATTTNATGVAQVAYTLGPSIGTQRAEALGGSLSGSPITFTVTARAAGGGGGGGGDPALRLPVAH